MKKLLFSYLMDRFVVNRGQSSISSIDGRRLKKYILIGGSVVVFGGLLFTGLVIWAFLTLLPSGDQVAGWVTAAKSQVAAVRTASTQAIDDSTASAPVEPTLEVQQKVQAVANEAKQSPLIQSLLAFAAPYVDQVKSEVAPYAGIAKGAIEEVRRQAAKSDGADPTKATQPNESERSGSF